jgi:ABC-2 type transport system permease protein
MSRRRILAMARKEVLHIVRDPRSLGLALALPLVMLLLFGYALSLDVDQIPMAVVDRDRTPESRELISRFEGSRYFRVVSRPEDAAGVNRGIDRGRFLLALEIEENFGGRLRAGKPANVQLLLDGSDSNTASIALGYVNGVIQAHAAALRDQSLRSRGAAALASPVDPRIRVWYNPDLKSKNYIVPGLIAVILMIIAALLTSLTIAREWETGTMEQLLSTPVRPAELVIGKLAAFFGLGVADMTVALVTGVVVFGVPLRGSVLLLAAASALFLTGALGWGIFISASARNQLMAYQLGTLTSFLPAFLLSGFIFSVENMPAVIQAISYLFPARYFITIIKGIFLKGVGFDLLALQFAFLAAYAGAVFVLATRRLKQKVA